MTTAPAIGQGLSCPSCNQKAKKVGTLTLGALLNDDVAGPFQAEDESCCGSTDCKPVSGSTGWRFCESPDCDVVYFSEEGDATFSKSQLKVPVGTKETTGDRPLCYCFGHSVTSIRDELASTGQSVALEDIRAKMKDPGCRCETENPSGACCLGSVSSEIKAAQAELGLSNSVGSSNATPGHAPTNRGEKIARIGTLVSAIMASSCCWLPLVLLAVGVSGAGIASTLEAYRPWFMVVTFGFLGAAFYFTYRPKKAATTGEPDCCGTEPTAGEEYCAPASKGRFNMMALNKVMLWGVTVMAVAFLFFPSYVGTFLGGDEKTVTEIMNRAVVNVEGMTCEGCSAIVAKAIRTAPGVLAVEVNYEKGEAIVGTEFCCPIPKQDILAAIREAGFEGQITHK